MSSVETCLYSTYSTSELLRLLDTWKTPLELYAMFSSVLYVATKGVHWVDFFSPKETQEEVERG